MFEILFKKSSKLATAFFFVDAILLIMKADDQALKDNMITHGETKEFSKQMGKPTFSFQ